MNDVFQILYARKVEELILKHSQRTRYQLAQMWIDYYWNHFDEYTKWVKEVTLKASMTENERVTNIVMAAESKETSFLESFFVAIGDQDCGMGLNTQLDAFNLAEIAFLKDFVYV